MSNVLIVKKAIARLNEKGKVGSDDQFNKQENRDKHEKAYTQILSAYEVNIENTLKVKRAYKHWVFWLSYLLLLFVFVLMTLLLIYLVVKKPYTGVKEWCMAVVPALVSFLTVFLVIPQIITKYLFNAEEEKYMSEIIKNIQNYDKETALSKDTGYNEARDD